MYSEPKRFSKALFFSLLFHLMVSLFLIFNESVNRRKNKHSEISVEIIDTTEINNKPKIIPNQEKALQVVDQKIDRNEELNATAKFLGEKNQRVEKETIAANRGEFQNVKNSKSAASGSSKKDKLIKKILPSLIPQLGMGEFRVSAVNQLKSGSSSDRNKATSTAGEVSQTQDYLKNKDRGLQTLLNTREFKYHSYYSRIRRQLSQHWEGKVRDRVAQIYKSGRSIASNQDRITKLLVVLNSTGLLVKVQVLNDSGIYDLDQAAIEAFRDAAPFPNPPRGIIESDGTVRIRWDMVLET